MSNKNQTIEEMAEKLTDLKIKVVANIVSGDYKSNRASYYAAGGDATNDNSADATVSAMLSEPKVKAYKKALLNAVAESALVSLTELKIRLSRVVQGDAFHEEPETSQDEVAQIKTSLLASKQLTDLEGWSAPKVIEVEGFESGYMKELIDALKKQ